MPLSGDVMSKTKKAAGTSKRDKIPRKRFEPFLLIIIVLLK
jgi:hypothetical protein